MRKQCFRLGIAGIYKIRNITNNRIYIGSSGNITKRWFNHIKDLKHNLHHNTELQNDYNIFGLDNFEFNIMETVDNYDSDEIARLEQKYIGMINLETSYNARNSDKEVFYKNRVPDIKGFINYINNRWLVKTNEDNINKYKIFKEDDKNEIIKMASKFNLFSMPDYLVTFNKVIGLLHNSLGYDIESGRIVVNKERHTYKLVLAYDEDKITYEPSFETVEE